jgi:hypothetical protein
MAATKTTTVLASSTFSDLPLFPTDISQVGPFIQTPVGIASLCGVGVVLILILIACYCCCCRGSSSNPGLKKEEVEGIQALIAGAQQQGIQMGRLMSSNSPQVSQQFFPPQFGSQQFTNPLQNQGNPLFYQQIQAHSNSPIATNPLIHQPYSNSPPVATNPLFLPPTQPQEPIYPQQQVQEEEEEHK